MIFLKKIIILALTISLYPGVACYRGHYIFIRLHALIIKRYILRYFKDYLFAF